MSRTNIDIDDEACSLVMRRYGLTTKRDAVNFALREAVSALSVDDAKAMRGSGWVGEFAELREMRGATSA